MYNYKIKNKKLLLILLIYLFITISLTIKKYIYYINIINPLFWGSILIYLICNTKKYYTRFYINKKYLACMIVISSIQISAFFYIGFILGFTKSPYNHDIISILKNVIIQILPIIGIEITRAIIVNRNKNNKLILIFISIISILIETKYNILINLYSNKEELFKYICSTIIPLIANNILFTYLTLNGACSLVLIYRVLKELAILLLPIFPDTDWFINGSTDVVSSIIIYVIFKYKIIKEKRDRENKKEKISYILTITISIIIISFMIGIFKYEPIAIMSDSMSPTFNRGDIIIFKKIKNSELEKIPKNSIIIYSIKNQNIAHRVIKTIKKEEKTLYQTKGDSNNMADVELVKTNQIKGVYMFHIKYIGFPSVWLYDYFNRVAK